MKYKKYKKIIKKVERLKKERLEVLDYPYDTYFKLGWRAAIDRTLDIIEDCKNNDSVKEYAKIRGWEKTLEEYRYWNYSVKLGSCVPGPKEETDDTVTSLKRDEWKDIGINKSNAVFEPVKGGE